MLLKSIGAGNGKERNGKMKEQHITIEHHGRKVSGRAYLPEKEKCPIVIFSHGFNGIGDDFKMQAEILARSGIAAVTYDFCGGALRSQSDMQTYEMTVFTEVEDLFSVFDTIKSWDNIDSDNIFLFGGSMGGLVSALAAEKRAAEIKGMILLYPALCVADNWNKQFPVIDDIPHVYNLWGVPLGKCFFETLHDYDVFGHIGKYFGRVLIMHGDRDEIVPVEYSEKAQKIYQNALLKIFGGEGHGFSSQGDEKVTRMLVEFVMEMSDNVC